MLQNLNSIGSEREVKPEQMSEGLAKMIEIEDTLIKDCEDGTFQFLDNASLEYLSESVDDFGKFTEKDLMDYILVRCGKNDRKVIDNVRGAITGKVLTSIYKRSMMKVMHFDLLDNYFPQLFVSIDKVDSLIVENAHCDNLVDVTQGSRVIQVAFANCSADYVLFSNSVRGYPDSSRIDRAYLSGCEGESSGLLSLRGSKNIDTVVAVNSRLVWLTPQLYLKKGIGKMVAVNCTFEDDCDPYKTTNAQIGHYVHIDKDGNTALQSDSQIRTGHCSDIRRTLGYFNAMRRKFGDVDYQRLYELGMSMQGKGGLEVAQIGDEMAKELERLRC